MDKQSQTNWFGMFDVVNGILSVHGMKSLLFFLVGITWTIGTWTFKVLSQTTEITTFTDIINSGGIVTVLALAVYHLYKDIKAERKNREADRQKLEARIDEINTQNRKEQKELLQELLTEIRSSGDADEPSQKRK